MARQRFYEPGERLLLLRLWLRSWVANCARSSDSFPSLYSSHLHYTECRKAVVAGIVFEGVAFHDGPGAYDPHQMVRATISPMALAVRTDTVRNHRSSGAARRCAVALGNTAALAVTAATAAAISQRAKAPGLARAGGVAGS